MIHDTPFFRIYWGNGSDGITASMYKGGLATALLDHPSFARLKQVFTLQDAIFLNQVHGTQGYVIQKDNVPKPFMLDGDYLITNTPGIALGVMTGDCLPVIFFDPRTLSIAIIHAGWRGSLEKVLACALEDFEKNFKVQRKNIKIFFGPSARACCYEVQAEFKNNLDHCAYSDKVLLNRGDTLYFDLPEFNCLLLAELGISRGSIFDQYNKCTICNEGFCSNRRQSANTEKPRQMTVVCLK